MSLLGKFGKSNRIMEKDFDPYFELLQVGVFFDSRKEIVENVYSFLGRIKSKPQAFRRALEDIREKRAYGDEAEKIVRDYLNLPYNSSGEKNHS